MERISTGPDSNFEIYKTSKKEGFYYQNGRFEYTPPGWVKLNKRWYPLGYRVTTLDNRSLGLAGNTNILIYSVNEWVGIPKRDVVPDILGRGGVWTAINVGDAWTLQRHCLNRPQNPLRTRVYLAALDNAVFATSYRVKSQRIMLLQEIK